MILSGWTKKPSETETERGLVVVGGCERRSRRCARYDHGPSRVWPSTSVGLACLSHMISSPSDAGRIEDDRTHLGKMEASVGCALVGWPREYLLRFCHDGSNASVKRQTGRPKRSEMGASRLVGDGALDPAVPWMWPASLREGGRVFGEFLRVVGSRGNVRENVPYAGASYLGEWASFAFALIYPFICNT
ncbi:hypothetical protein GY45DRAFT_720832 [Cubamyces sp. BRFM 1775]|nr:hypothetical protein GY45DRAFT_720832 [Cubamyces sp. BRFM 1775]